MAPVSLWLVKTDRLLPPEFNSILAPDEQIKAQRFHFISDQRRYRLMRIALRRLLAETLNCDPRAIHFHYSANGKPILAKPDRQVYFNISHSGDYGLIGIADDQLIGVDLEFMQPKSDSLKLAQRFFSPSESVWLNTQSPANQDVAFYQLWTAKEAFLKAIGVGISAGLDTVILSKNFQKYESLPDPYQTTNWQLRSQPFFDHYWGAIALNSPEKQLNSVEIQSYCWE
jgi:4'-phosphopantetheinyl transferase